MQPTEEDSEIDTKSLIKNTSDSSAGPLPKDIDQTFRKITWKLVPSCFALVFLSYVDRANLGIAARAFCADLSLSSASYGTGVGIFFITYSFFQIPSNLVLDVVRAPIWLGFIMIVWGAVASSMAFVTNKWQFYVLRCILGMAEAGSFPGMWHYLCDFFPERYRTTPLLYIELGTLLSQVVGPPLGGAILLLDGFLGWSGWHWLFFLEGIPSVGLGVWFATMLPHTPRAARFLSPREVRLVEAQFETSPARPIQEKLLFRITSVLRNRNLWLASFVKMFRVMTTDVALFWVPLWINAMWKGEGLSVHSHNKHSCGGPGNKHHSDAMVAVLTTFPFAIAATTAALLVWHSNSKSERTNHIGITYMVGAIAFALLPVASRIQTVLGFITLILVVSTTNGPSAILISLATSYLSTESRAIGLALLNSVSHLGGYFGAALVGWTMDWTGGYTLSVLILSGLLLLGGMIAVLLPDKMKRETNIESSTRSPT